ncbi:MAG: glycosyltransferase [Ilumatobacteraceae bacterium]
MPIDAVVVAVPARNEAPRLERCIISIDAAVGAWGGAATIVVGADACTDGTAEVLAGLRAAGLPVLAVEGEWRRPSRVRRALVTEARAALAHVPAERVWLASTDADCVVPRHWIADQVRLADAGADVVLGEVALDPVDTPPGLAGLFDERYAALRERRRHVHAANLGIRLSAYDAAGGWRSSTAIGEEHHLVRRAGDLGAAVSWGDDLTVMTSGRTTGRVSGGFASVLRRLTVPVAAG